MTYSRHAIIILAHGRLAQLQMLVDCLADPDFDIYLHLDAGAKAPDGWLEKLAEEHPNLVFLPRKELYWGDVSLVKAELDAFRTILDSGREYSHIHLLSGQDLPLKRPVEIKEFFIGRNDREFVDIRDKAHTNHAHVRCLIPFPKYLKYKKGSHLKYRLVKILNQIAYISEKLILMHFWRNRSYDYRMSSQWVSITPDAAAYLVGRSDRIMKRYAHALAPDEFFLASELWNSGFRNAIEKDNLRYIKWGAPNTPHPFDISMKDFEPMTASGALFARKFDLDTDQEVIASLIRRITSLSVE